MEMNPHHLVMGEITDFLTGITLADTHDERYRQKLAKRLVLDLGFYNEELVKDWEITVSAGSQKAKLKIDFLISLNGRTCMAVKYAPGSLVTRRLSNLAFSRIIRPYQIPIMVTFNGEDAEIINGSTGKVTAHGIDGIPKREALLALDSFPSISAELFEKASRIAFACEVNGACPCDTDICVLEDIQGRTLPG